MAITCKIRTMHGSDFTRDEKGIHIRLSGNDCRLASMGKRFEIDQN